MNINKPCFVEQVRKEYQEKGYVLIKNFLNQEKMSCLTQWIDEIIAWPTVSGKWLKYYELLENQERVLSRIENFVVYHPGLKEWVSDPVILSVLSECMGESVLFFKEKLNLKPSGARGYTAHQDAPAFFDIDYDAISLFIPIDPATLDNGCLYFVKNGERYRPVLLEQNLHNRALSKNVVDSFQWEPIVCDAGDVILFSSYAPHFSKKNETLLARKALFLTFGSEAKSIGKTEVYYGKKRKIFPQDSEKDPNIDYTAAAAIYSFSSPVIVNASSKKK